MITGEEILVRLIIDKPEGAGPSEKAPDIGDSIAGLLVAQENRPQ